MQSRILKMKRLTLLGFIALMYLALSGCANPKDANKRNFQAAISDYLKDKPACIKVTTAFGGKIKFPYRIRKFSYLSNEQLLKKFVAIGFLSSQKIDNPGYRRATIYDLTDKGLSHFNESENGFCYGKLRVKEILNFTEPNSKSNSGYSYYSQLAGYTISTVNYTVETFDIDIWVKSEEVKKVFPAIKLMLNGKTSLRDSTTLILTNDGWVHSDYFRNNQIN